MGVCFSSLHHGNEEDAEGGSVVTGKDNKGASSRSSVKELRNGHRHGSSDSFRRYTLEEVLEATGGFATENIVSEGGEDAPNRVYKAFSKVGAVEEERAVKRLDNVTWPHPKMLSVEAKKVGSVRHEALVGLLGFCVEGEERLLVCEYMEKGTLASHLFHWERAPLPWSMRMRVACRMAKVLDYLSSVAGLLLYHDLNAYRVMFDKDWNPKLSCFGLIKNSTDGHTFSTNLAYAPPEYLKRGVLTAESVVYSFGMLLLDMISGKHIPPSRALELMQRMNPERLLVDSHLENNYSEEAAAKVAQLVYRCLQKEPESRPRLRQIIEVLEPLQASPETPSHELMAFVESAAPLARNPVPPPRNRIMPTSAFGVAAARGDFATLRKLMIQMGYKEDETTQTELSFQAWQPGIQDWLATRKHGDDAFVREDVQEALEAYAKLKETEGLVSPTVMARRCLCWLMMAKWEQALADGMAAQGASPNWPVAYYLQAAALSKLESMAEDSLDMLDKGAQLDAHRHSDRGYMMSGG